MAEETPRRRIVTISEDAMRAFVDDLLEPGEPGERLRLYAEMRRETGDGR